MRTSERWALLASLLLLSGCGFMLQRASVARNFGSRFGCQGARVTRVGGGYHVKGCGQIAEYVCRPDYRPGYGHVRSDPDDSMGEVLGGIAFAGLFAGANEHCYLAYAQQQSNPAMPVASAAPAPIRRARSGGGETVLKARVLFAGGHLSARAEPRKHAQHALLVVHGTARLPAGACEAEIYHDGVPVPVLDQRRPSAYDVQLLVPIAALEGVESAVRFAGTVCGLSFDLDPSSRATLGLFAVQFQEEVTRTRGLTAASAPAVAPR